MAEIHAPLGIYKNLQIMERKNYQPAQDG